MKRILLLICCVFLLCGCGIKESALTNVLVDLATYEVLKNNPDKADDVVAALEAAKAVLNGNMITYSGFGDYLQSEFTGEMQIIGEDILQDDIPFISLVPISDDAKITLNKRIDRLIAIAGRVNG